MTRTDPGPDVLLMKLSDLDPCLWQSYEHPASTSSFEFPDIHSDTFAELKPLPPFEYSPNGNSNGSSINTCSLNSGGGGGGGGGGLASLLTGTSPITATLQPGDSNHYDGSVSTTTSNIKTELAEYLLNSDIDDIAALIGSAIAEQQQTHQLPTAEQVSSSTIDPWTELDAWIENACQQTQQIATSLEQDSTIHTTDYSLPPLMTDYGFTSSPILQARLQSSPQQLPESTTTTNSSNNFTNLKVDASCYNTHIEPHVSPTVTSSTPGPGSNNGNNNSNNSNMNRYGSNNNNNGPNNNSNGKVFSASTRGQHLFSLPIVTSLGSSDNHHPHHHLHAHQQNQQLAHLHHHLTSSSQHPHSIHHQQHLQQQQQQQQHHANSHNGGGGEGGRSKKEPRRLDQHNSNTTKGSSPTKLPSFPFFVSLQKVKKRNGNKKSSLLSSSLSSGSSPPSSSSLSSSSLSPSNGGGGGGGGGVGSSCNLNSNGNNNGLSSTTNTSSSMSDLSDKEKPIHRCNICSRGFLNKSNIKVHLRTHTGEKPFKCEVCSKAFRQKAHLLKHVQIHKRIPRD